MGVVRFYHLTRSPLEATLRTLLGKALEAGQRVDLRTGPQADLDALDRALWLGDEAGFLPHGVAGGPHDADQPILLTPPAPLRPDTTCLICVEGARVAAGEAATLARAFLVFDGTDAAALDAARGQWKTLAATDLTTEYWSEETGRWARKA